MEDLNGCRVVISGLLETALVAGHALHVCLVANPAVAMGTLALIARTSGDSYSSIGYDVHGDRPNATNIIGNPPFPGDTTAGGPNWVRVSVRLLC